MGRAKKNLSLGPVNYPMPIDAKNGPLTHVALRANVTIPEVTMTSEHLDFAPVWVGCSRTLSMQLQNVSPVTAEWEFKKPIGSNKDETKFCVERALRCCCC